MNDATQAAPTAKATKAKPQEEMVTMKDGRVVAFVGKRKMLKESLVDDATGKVAVRLDFRNGEIRTFVIPDSLKDKFAAHGAEQKLGDETAGAEDIDDMILWVDELTQRLSAGEWSAAREGGGGVSGVSVLIRAIMESSGKTAEQIKAWLETETKRLNTSKQQLTTALRNSKTLKPIVDKIEAEKAAKASSSINAEELLGGLDAIQ